MFKLFILSFFYLSASLCLDQPNNVVVPSTTLQVGDNIANFANGKLLALCYNLPFYYVPFNHSNCFALSSLEKPVSLIDRTKYETLHVWSNQIVVENIGKDKKLFLSSILTPVLEVKREWLAELRKDLQPIKTPIIKELPKDLVTVAVHIRKGNGGGEVYDGTLSSQQLFDFDRSLILYLPASERFNYAFDWETYVRDLTGKLVSSSMSFSNYRLTRSFEGVDLVNGYETKFPPEQYYVDQIKKLSELLKNTQLFVQIFTDDKDPEFLVQRVKKEVNLANVVFHYEDNRNKGHEQRIIEDLYSMSRFQALIRSQSYFARVAELMGDPEIVFSPLSFKWLGKKLIMTTVVVRVNKGNLLKL